MNLLSRGNRIGKNIDEQSCGNLHIDNNDCVTIEISQAKELRDVIVKETR